MAPGGLPEPIRRLIEELAKLPGIGEKNATRLAFHIFRSPDAYARNLSGAIAAAKSEVGTCDVCFSFAAGRRCDICSDPRRDSSLVCVVEEPLDLMAIERSGEFRGLYHVLHGAISPLEGVGPEDLRVGELVRSPANGGARPTRRDRHRRPTNGAVRRAASPLERRGAFRRGPPVSSGSGPACTGPRRPRRCRTPAPG